jgi:hypothetical protein
LLFFLVDDGKYGAYGSSDTTMRGQLINDPMFVDNVYLLATDEQNLQQKVTGVCEIGKVLGLRIN